MSKRAKIPQPVLKASRTAKPKVENKISVSFQFLTKNNRHNFNFFSKTNFRLKTSAFEQLFEFLQTLTSKTQLEIANLPKERGFELIALSQLKFKPALTLGQDTKICVFRFGDNSNGGDYRLLGFFEHGQNVLEIIGFDFDYSAYNH